MAAQNAEIADIFDTLADLLEIEDANPFRVRAYRNAARVVRQQSRSLADRVRAGEDLSELPSIGHDLAEKIATIVDTGKLPLLEELEARTPGALSGLMKVAGLGPKRVKKLYRELGIRSAEDLRRALARGKIRKLEGFGAKLEETIANSLEQQRGREQRTGLQAAEQVADDLVRYLKGTAGLRNIVVAGSFRRRCETVGDLDILVTARKGSPIMDRFVRYDRVARVLSKGETRASVKLQSGLQVDLRVVPQVSYGAALYYFTGSKAHNIAVRKMALERKLKINEYGVFKGRKRVAGATEKEVFRQVGLPYIEPELREARGEIEAARKGGLPKLVTTNDIRGDLHSHTKATDGRNSLAEMVAAAAERGHEYVAVTDHSKHVAIAHGLDKKRLAQQLRRIDRLNEKSQGIVILKSIEVDILEDGSLDLPDDILKSLDLTVCSVHYKFDLPRKKQTERILRAMDNLCFNILAHPTGRLIGERSAYDIDLERIMEGARDRGCFLEVNAQPDRLDLNDVACKLAKDVGAKVVISSDAHSTGELDYLRFGIAQARRGWLETGDVINTRKLASLRKLLQRV